jgi:TonB family protein
LADRLMITIRNMRIRGMAISVLIHGILIAIVLFSRPPQMPDAVMVTPIDDSYFPFPEDEPMKPLAEPKSAIAASKPHESEKLMPPTVPNSVVNENEDIPLRTIPVAIGNSRPQPPHEELPKIELASARMEGMPVLFEKPMSEKFAGGNGMSMPAGNASGNAGAAGSGYADKGVVAGSGSFEQSTGVDTVSVGFGSSAGPRFLRRKIPEYPVAARKRKIEGKVVLAIIIDSDGCLKNIDIIEASDPMFVNPIIEALKKSSFIPASRNGRPITVKAILPIRFALQD